MHLRAVVVEGADEAEEVQLRPTPQAPHAVAQRLQQEQRVARHPQGPQRLQLHPRRLAPCRQCQARAVEVRAVRPRIPVRIHSNSRSRFSIPIPLLPLRIVTSFSR